MYKQYTIKEYEEVIKLRNSFGWSAKRISDFLLDKEINIKIGAICGWIYNNKMSSEERLIKIPENSKDMTKEKAYILGVLCSDGYISTCYRIGLEVCDYDFIQEFKRCVKFVYNLEVKIIKRNRKTNFGEGKPQYCGILCSKNVYSDLLKYGSFKTKEWMVPKEVLESSNLEIKSAFLRGLFDSEGTIRSQKKGSAQLQICSGNNNALLAVKKMLLIDFEIDTKINFNNNQVMMLHTSRYEYLKIFFDKIGFTIKRKNDRLIFYLSQYKRKGLRKYDNNFKLKVLQLWDKGIPASEIGKILNFNRTNIYDFIEERAKLENNLKE